MFWSLLKMFLILSLITNNEAVLYEGDPCTIRDAPGVCKHQDQCPQLERAYRQHLIRNDEIPRCGYTLHREVICCPLAEISAFNSPTLTGRVYGSAAIEFCHELQNLSLNALEFHIVNGLPVKEHEYGFMASIGHKKVSVDEEIMQFHCGGALITDRFVLTAAHCVSDPINLPNIVMLGSLFLNEAIDESLFDIKKTHIHKDYRPGSTYNDIALVELATSVQFEASVYPLCLHTDIFSPPAEWKAYVAGWGRTENALQSNRLLKAEVSVVPLSSCRSELARMFPTRRLSQGVQDTQICAKGDARDACEGDSGGPLVYVTPDNAMYAAGITVAGFDCVGAVPALYTRVASYINFIENIVWPNKATVK